MSVYITKTGDGEGLSVTIERTCEGAEAVDALMHPLRTSRYGSHRELAERIGAVGRQESHVDRFTMSPSAARRAESSRHYSRTHRGRYWSQGAHTLHAQLFEALGLDRLRSVA